MRLVCIVRVKGYFCCQRRKRSDVVFVLILFSRLTVNTKTDKVLESFYHWNIKEYEQYQTKLSDCSPSF